MRRPTLQLEQAEILEAGYSIEMHPATGGGVAISITGKRGTVRTWGRTFGAAWADAVARARRELGL